MITTKLYCPPKTFGGSTKPESSYYKFREKIREHANKELSRVKNEEVSVFIKLYITKKKAQGSDLDNYLKPIIDGLSDFYDKWTKQNKKSVIEKEYQINSICIRRLIVKENKDEGIIIGIDKEKNTNDKTL
jgi:Holliday junction resolvase RusA-like endonuclease